MRIDILTLFPEMMEAVLSESIIGRARKSGKVTINCVNIRDFTRDKHRRVDDYPYGGGRGMLMQAEPIYEAYKSVCAEGETPPLIYMSPQGQTLTQDTAHELSGLSHIVVLCGHYEGVDERALMITHAREISIGDYVLTGGELPALVLCDAVCRLLPGVLKDDESFLKESHQGGLLEYPQYTRPEEYMGMRVPDVLLSGHHENVEKWRREQSLERTRDKRPDLYEKYMGDRKDAK
ncbi:MAG: tRNA (guanosine(37)-N1)-methyltransferase TrmD [Clostridia bacterium]|nr:tRNA (guanosine(37)-N1)-methyltransferase TrmD [Clostridia bacterium]